MLQRLGQTLFGTFRNSAAAQRIRPTKTEGTHGTAVYGGWLETQETSPDLSSPQKACRDVQQHDVEHVHHRGRMRIFLQTLIGAATWTVTPSEADTQETYAQMAQELLFDDPITSWRRIMRRASMYKFWGYSFSEWTMRKRPEGWLTYHDVAPRAQRTVEYWNVDPTGEVHGIWQRSPQTQEYLYIPRGKTDLPGR